MDWIKKHVDTVAVIGSILGALVWMQTQFTKVNDKMISINDEVKKEIASVQKDVAVIKAVLMMKNIMPPELVAKKEVKE